MIYNEEKTSENFFSDEEGEKILEAITGSESRSTGEIRLHLEEECNGDALERAAEVFQLLKMDQTGERNGVIIYISVKDHKLAIYGDEGINKLTPDDFWDHIIEQMQTDFREGRFLHGVLYAINEVGKSLEQLFPFKDKPNELDNSISYGTDLEEGNE